MVAHFTLRTNEKQGLLLRDYSILGIAYSRTKIYTFSRNNICSTYSKKDNQIKKSRERPDIILQL